eukprot:COSAG02_NODE_529_length_20702_cov_43.720555_19_plen_418_part_00
MTPAGEDDDTASLLAGAPTGNCFCGTARGSRRVGEHGEPGELLHEPGQGHGPGTEKDDGKQRKLCYIRTRLSVIAISEVEHTFRVQGGLDLFWKEEKDFVDRVNQLDPDIDLPLGSVDDGAYQGVVTLPDDGSSSLPINPNKLFANQLELSDTARPKVLFDARHGIVHYSLFFKATLSARFDMHNFPFDRQMLPITLNFRSGSFTLSPGPFEGVPNKWGLRTPASITLGSVPADQYRLRLDGPCVGYDCSTWKPTIQVFCERIATPWIWSVVIPAFMLVVAGGSIVLIPAEEIGDRVATLLSLMLTMVALKFSVADKLPVVPYLTKLDIELFLGLAVLFVGVLAASASCVLCVLWPQARDDATPWTATDLWVLGLSGGLWVVLHGLALAFDMRKSWHHVRAREPIHEHDEVAIFGSS